MHSPTFHFLSGSQAAWNSIESTNWSHVAFIKPEDINNDGYVDILISYRGESKEKEAPTVLINISGKNLLPYQLAGNNNENFVISGEGNTLKYELFSNGSIIEKYINTRPEAHLEKGKRKVVMYTDRSHLASEQSDVISGDFLPDYVQLMGGNDKFMGGIGEIGYTEIEEKTCSMVMRGQTLFMEIWMRTLYMEVRMLT